MRHVLGSKAQICIANISPRERRRRLAGGVISLAISLALLAILMVLGKPRLWRLALIITFGSAGAGFFQWYDKT
jgi:hypothetical protein